MKKITIILALILAVVGTYTPAQAQTPVGDNDYYVGNSGSDTADGSFASPFRTLAKGVSLLQAGDTLHVMDGVYNETLKVAKIGAADAPITIEGDNWPTLDGGGTIPNVVDVSGAYITIIGFEVTGARSFGTFNTGSFITFKNNLVHGNVTSNGIAPNCNDAAVPGWGSAMKDKVLADNSVYRGNIVFGNCGEGIAITRGAGSLVEGNIIYDNFVGGVYVDNSFGVLVQDNDIYCTQDAPTWKGNTMHAVAIGEESYSGWGAQLHDVTVRHNSMTGCRTGLQTYASAVGGTLTDFTFDDNTVFSATKRTISMDNTKNLRVTISNNKLYALDWWVRATAGVTFFGNVLLDIIETVTATITSIVTNTPMIPTGTMTFTALVKTPTITNTPIVAIATPSPSKTATPSRTPTAIKTYTPTPKTPTISPLPSTGTFTPVYTNTPLVSTPGYLCDPVYIPFGICIYKLP